MQRHGGALADPAILELRQSLGPSPPFQRPIQRTAFTQSSRNNVCQPLGQLVWNWHERLQLSIESVLLPVRHCPEPVQSTEETCNSIVNVPTAQNIIPTCQNLPVLIHDQWDVRVKSSNRIVRLIMKQLFLSVVFGMMSWTVFAQPIPSFFASETAFNTSPFLTVTNYDPVHGFWTNDGPTTVSFDGTNFTILTAKDYLWPSGILMFRGPALTTAALTNYGIVIPALTIAGQTNFTAAGGIYTENGTNYCPINGPNASTDYPGSVHLAYAPAGSTNWQMYKVNGVTVTILQADSQSWDHNGLYRGSFCQTNGHYYLFLNGAGNYTNINGNVVGESTGFATATNIFGPWAMSTNNPVLPNINEPTVGDPMIFNWNGIWVMSYNTFFTPLNFAYSYDLTNWFPSPYNHMVGPPLGTKSYRWCFVNSNNTYYAVSDPDGTPYHYLSLNVTIPWNPQVLNSSTHFGAQSHDFGFNITWPSGQSVSVEACTNLFNPMWQPVETLLLINGSASFDDSEWTNYPGRFYRLSYP
jgi:hypothetical protein